MNPILEALYICLEAMDLYMSQIKTKSNGYKYMMTKSTTLNRREN